MICTKKLTGKSSTSVWASPIYYQDIENGNWASEFVSIQNVQVTNTGLQFWATIGSYSTISAGTTRILRPDNYSQTYNIDIFAIGKWK